MNNNVIRYSPQSLNREEFLTPFSSLFDEFFNSSFPDFTLGKEFFESGAYPKVDVRNEDTQIVIEAEVPGVKKEQLSIELKNGILSIKGDKQDSSGKSSKNYIHKELKRSAFCRSFTLGDIVDGESINAKFENGILEITLKKLNPTPLEEGIKKIEIK